MPATKGLQQGMRHAATQVTRNYLNGDYARDPEGGAVQLVKSDCPEGGCAQFGDVFATNYKANDAYGVHRDYSYPGGMLDGGGSGPDTYAVQENVLIAYVNSNFKSFDDVYAKAKYMEMSYKFSAPVIVFTKDRKAHLVDFSADNVKTIGSTPDYYKRLNQ